MLGGQLTELLVGERLERRRVEGLAAGGEGAVHGVGGDEGLAGAGRRRDQHRAALVDGVECFDLVGVRLEAQAAEEPLPLCGAQRRKSLPTPIAPK